MTDQWWNQGFASMVLGSEEAKDEGDGASRQLGTGSLEAMGEG